MAPRTAPRCHEAESRTSEEECPAMPASDQWQVGPRMGQTSQIDGGQCHEAGHQRVPRPQQPCQSTFS